MATILLVDDRATVSLEVTRLLEAGGHRVVRCGGGPTPLAACLLLRYGRCPFVDSADLLIFACTLALPLPGRSYRGIHLLRAYRAHPDYGRLPLVLLAVAPPHDLRGAGPIEVVETYTDPTAVVAAVNRLLQSSGQTPDRPSLTTTTCVVRWPGQRGDRPQSTSEPSDGIPLHLRGECSPGIHAAWSSLHRRPTAFSCAAPVPSAHRDGVVCAQQGRERA
jgi:CheY-like chemotaxis protein